MQIKERRHHDLFQKKGEIQAKSMKLDKEENFIMLNIQFTVTMEQICLIMQKITEEQLS